MNFIDPDRRDTMADWLRANDIDPATVPLDTSIDIHNGPDGLVIAYWEHLGKGIHERRFVPLLVEPPDWAAYVAQLQPLTDEQREQLQRMVTVTAEIRKIAEAVAPAVIAAAAELTKGLEALREAGLLDEDGKPQEQPRRRPTPFECAPGNRCHACAVCWR
ncbi:hypothetical protein ACIQAC_01375 [Streptomyces sp. NPDC088387]|uniref:hypothetical protein n=1 Tax=Streptomyces sp. NPDC088387 TaxID=3365859 RepID=UPI00381CBBBE